MNYHKFEYLESTERRWRSSGAGPSSPAVAHNEWGCGGSGDATLPCRHPIRVTPSALDWLLHAIVYTIEFHAPAEPRPRQGSLNTHSDRPRQKREESVASSSFGSSSIVPSAASTAAAAVGSVVTSFFGWGGGGGTAHATPVPAVETPESKREQLQRAREAALREKQLSQPAVVPIVQQISHLGGFYIVVCHDHNKTIEPARQLALSRIMVLLRERQEKNARLAATAVLLREQQLQQLQAQRQLTEQQQQQQQQGEEESEVTAGQLSSTKDEDGASSGLIASLSTAGNLPAQRSEQQLSGQGGSSMAQQQQQQPAPLAVPPLHLPERPRNISLFFSDKKGAAAAADTSKSTSPVQRTSTGAAASSPSPPQGALSPDGLPGSLHGGAGSFASGHAGSGAFPSVPHLPPLTANTNGSNNSNSSHHGQPLPPPFGLLPGELGLELAVRLLCAQQSMWRGTQQRVLAELTFPVIRTADETSVLTYPASPVGSLAGSANYQNDALAATASTSGSPTQLTGAVGGSGTPDCWAAGATVVASGELSEARDVAKTATPMLILANNPKQMQDVVRFISDSFYKAISLDTFADFTAGELVFDIQVKEKRGFTPPRTPYEASQRRL